MFKDLKSLKLNKFEKIVTLSLLFAPFTSLRFNKVGVVELCCLLLFFKVLKLKKIKKWHSKFLFSRFWIAYIGICLFGFIYNVVFLKHSTGTIKGFFFDLVAYLFVFIICFSLEYLIFLKKIDPLKILKYAFLCLSIIMGVLYVLSFFTTSLLGIPLLYSGYFAPLADNLHQVCMVLVPMPFLGLLMLSKIRTKKSKLLVIAFIILNYIMAVSTGASKANISFVVGSVTLLGLWFYNKIQIRNRVHLISIFFGFILLLVIVYYNELLSLGIGFFNDNDGGEGRQNLYKKALVLIMDSPVLGHGSGSHIWSNGMFYDAHQTFLTILLQTGIIGALLFASLLYKIGVKLLNTPIVSAGFMTIVVYIMGGDILRRVPIWIFLVLFYYSCSTIRVKSFRKNKLVFKKIKNDSKKDYNII